MMVHMYTDYTIGVNLTYVSFLVAGGQSVIYVILSVARWYTC